MSKARDLANAGTALTTVSATELGYLDGVTSAVQTQINAKEATLPDQTGNTGKYLTTNGTAKSWGTVSQYALPSQTGNSGKYLTTNGTAESWGTVSVPLKWTLRKSAHAQQINAFATNGSGTYVAGGDNGEIYSSTDSGVTWTARTSQFSTTQIEDISFGNGLFVAVGQSGKISTSSDGITWTARTSNMSTNTIRAVAYGNGVWVAVGVGGGATNTGGITYSTDGTTWTRKSQTPSVGATYYTVVWNGTNWVVGANTNGTNNYLYATTPSGTWTAAVAINSSIDVRVIYWDGTKHIFQADTGGWFLASAGATITGGTGYSGAPSPQSVNLYGSKYYSGSVYAYGIYVQSFVTGTNGYPDISTLIFAPSTYSTTSPTNAAGSIWVGAAGILIGDNRGRIYTSF
jgi:hypothetical protein